MLNLSIGELFVRCVQTYAPIAEIPDGYPGLFAEWEIDRAASSVTLVMLACDVPDIILEKHAYQSSIADVALDFVDSYLRMLWVGVVSDRAKRKKAWCENWDLQFIKF